MDNRKCLNCGKIIPLEKLNNKFCNSSCAAKFNNKGVSRNKKHEHTNCMNCEKPLNRYGKFCNNNNKCKIEFYKKKRYKQYEKDQCFSSQKKAREYFLYKFGNKCQICGTETWNGQLVPLVIDHIDGNPDNNYFNNLRLICRNCDGLLPTYCRKNKNGKNSKRNKLKLEYYYNNK